MGKTMKTERRARGIDGKVKLLLGFSLAGVIRDWLCCVLDLATVDLCLSPQKMLGQDLEAPTVVGKTMGKGSLVIPQYNMRRVVVSDHESITISSPKKHQHLLDPFNQLRNIALGADYLCSTEQI